MASPDEDVILRWKFDTDAVDTVQGAVLDGVMDWTAMPDGYRYVTNFPLTDGIHRNGAGNQ